MQMELLGDDSIVEAIAFYEAHAHYGLRYPNDEQWLLDRLGTDFFLIGIRANRELIALAWIAKKEDLLYFTIEDEHLVLKNDGAHFDSGGWCVRPDYQGGALFQLLAAALFASWFGSINKHRTLPLWGRMIGQKDDDGHPLFWNCFGEHVTGLPYRELLELPFGTMERRVFARWPSMPISLGDIPTSVLEQIKGKTFNPLVKAGRRLSGWGFVDVVDRYVPFSLNFFKRLTWNSVHRSIGNPEEFLQKACFKAQGSTSKPFGSQVKGHGKH